MIADPAHLIEGARARTGLDDFGPDGWQEGLDRLHHAAVTDLDLDEATTARLEATIHGRLTNRLEIEDWYRHQQDPPRPISGIVVIHGLPRTATTALHYLLALQPSFRYQRRWEAGRFVPPTGATSDHDDERRRTAADQGDQGGSVQHIASLDGPIDDNAILGLSFGNQELGLPLPSFTRWWRSASLKSTYAYHERVLRMLHTGRPPTRWLVKAPYHNFHLGEMAAQYPQARFIMAHRDPAAAFPSACSTVATAQRNALPLNPPDDRRLGAFLLEHLVVGIERAMADRAVIGEARFFDVTQKEMESDAVGTAQRIHDFLGIPLDASTRSAMAKWAGENQRGARGLHHYSAQQFGTTTAQIRKAFSAYMERFDVPPENP